VALGATSSSQVLITRRCVEDEVVAARRVSSELGTACGLCGEACTTAAGGGATAVAAWSPHQVTDLLPEEVADAASMHMVRNRDDRVEHERREVRHLTKLVGVLLPSSSQLAGAKC